MIKPDKMNKSLLFAAFFCLLATVSCDKAVENKQKDLLIEAMTNGVWLVDFYSENNIDITSYFDGYEFQFVENGVVMATKNYAMTHGTWTGDFETQMITSDFPGATDPLAKLNGSWKIVDSHLDYVKSERITTSGKNILYLKKKV